MIVVDASVLVSAAWPSDVADRDDLALPVGWREGGVEALAWYSSFHYCPYA